MKYLVLLLVTLAIVGSPALADCLSSSEQDALIAIALSSNQSPSLLVDIFEKSCNYSYSKKELDDMIEVEIDDQTEWLEEQIDITGYLRTMSDNMNDLMNATGTMNQMEHMVDDLDEKWEERLQGVLEEIDAEQLSRNDVYDIIDDHDTVNQADPVPWWGFPLVGIMALGMILYYLQWDKKGKIVTSMTPKGLRDRVSHLQFTTPGKPKLPHQYEKIEQAKRDANITRQGDYNEKPSDTTSKGKQR